MANGIQTKMIHFPKIMASPKSILIPDDVIHAVTEKIDGSQFSIGFNKSHNTISFNTRRNILLKNIDINNIDHDEILDKIDKTNRSFVGAVKIALNRMDRVLQLIDMIPADIGAIYFEYYGHKIQRRIPYKNCKKSQDIILFQILVANNKSRIFMSFEDVIKLSELSAVSCVPILDTVDLHSINIDEYASKKFEELKSSNVTLAENGGVEGFVFWPFNYYPTKDEIVNNNIVFKLLSVDFILRKGKKITGLKTIKQLNVPQTLRDINIENIIYSVLSHGHPEFNGIDNLKMSDAKWIVPAVFDELISEHPDVDRKFDDKEQQKEYQKAIRKVIARELQKIISKY